MLELGVKVLFSYLLGAINGSLLLGRLKGVDIRTMGSGNAGGTNALRTQGKWFALGVMCIDVGKGWGAAALLPGVELPGIPSDAEISRAWLMYACGGAAVVGHCYPVWFRFEGGKGAATAVGALVAAAPALILPALLVWVAVLVITGYVGLATMLSALAMPAWVVLTDWPGGIDVFSFTAALAIFIVYTHRSNIGRLRRGEENRMSIPLIRPKPPA